MKTLNPEILKILVKKTGMSEGSIRNSITKLANIHSQSTPNALAQIFALSRNFSVRQKLDAQDKASIPQIEFLKPKVKIQQNIKKLKQTKIIKLVDYDTEDFFKKGHIEEVNRAYSLGCFTAAFVLVRKIVENLIIDILKKKFPENSQENKELYFDISKNRFKDFSVILDNLHSKKNTFGTDNKLVERLYQKAKGLKDNTNDKTHSWFHLVKNTKEFTDLEVETIIALIKNLEKNVGMR